jgi:hypothetical protein
VVEVQESALSSLSELNLVFLHGANLKVVSQRVLALHLGAGRKCRFLDGLDNELAGQDEIVNSKSCNIGTLYNVIKHCKPPFIIGPFLILLAHNPGAALRCKPQVLIDKGVGGTDALFIVNSRPFREWTTPMTSHREALGKQSALSSRSSRDGRSGGVLPHWSLMKPLEVSRASWYSDRRPGYLFFIPRTEHISPLGDARCHGITAR